MFFNVHGHILCLLLFDEESTGSIVFMLFLTLQQYQFSYQVQVIE